MFPIANFSLKLEVDFADLFMLSININNGYNHPCFYSIFGKTST